MSELTEADRYLLTRIREGESDGWSQFVDRYQGRLLAFARDRLRNAADAEDAVQETFMSFLKALGHFREQASLESFLFSILRRKIANTYRGRPVLVCSIQAAARDEANVDNASALWSSSDHGASWYVRRGEEHDLLHKTLWTALRDLVEYLRQKPNFRDLKVAEMIFYAQLRNQDIAHRIDMDAKQVALIKHRFLKRISQQVSQLQREGTAHAMTDSTRDDVLGNEDLLTQVWEDQRPSCPKRSTIGAYLLGVLDPPWHDYVDFHLNLLGCRFCRANRDDLERVSGEVKSTQFRNRIMQSTVGFLGKS